MLVELLSINHLKVKKEESDEVQGGLPLSLEAGGASGVTVPVLLVGTVKSQMSPDPLTT